MRTHPWRPTDLLPPCFKAICFGPASLLPQVQSREREPLRRFFVSMYYLTHALSRRLSEQPSDKQEIQSKSASLRINRGFLRRHSLVAQPGSFRHAQIFVVLFTVTNQVFPVTLLSLKRDFWEMLRQRI